jgi:hypothetical protein
MEHLSRAWLAQPSSLVAHQAERPSSTLFTLSTRTRKPCIFSI